MRQSDSHGWSEDVHTHRMSRSPSGLGDGGFVPISFRR